MLPRRCAPLCVPSQVERIGWTATGAEVASSNKFIKARLEL